MVLRASFLLVALTLGPTLGMDGSLWFSRELLCGLLDHDDNDERSCSRKIGNGYCLDSIGQYFPLCASPLSEDLSLTACQKVGTDTSGAVGLVYSSNSACAILFDAAKAATFTCPTGYTRLDADQGTGSVQNSNGDDTSSLVCYKCETN